MGLAFIPLYIKYLGIESYGLIGLFAVLQAWLVLLDMGMTPALGREMARFTGGTHSAQSIRDLLRSIEVVALGMAIAIGIGIWLASDWLATNWLRAEKLSTQTVAHAFTVMGVVTALRFAEGSHTNQYRRGADLGSRYFLGDFTLWGGGCGMGMGLSERWLCVDRHPIYVSQDLTNRKMELV